MSDFQSRLCALQDKVDRLVEEMTECRENYYDAVKQRNDWHGMYEDEHDRAEGYKQALQKIADIRLEPAYCWEQSQFVKRIVQKALRGGEE